jgi:hypothetical protein
MKETILPLACDTAKIPYGASQGDSIIAACRKGETREGLILAEYAGHGGSYTLPCPMYDHLSERVLSGCVTLKPYEVLVLEKRDI